MKTIIQRSVGVFLVVCMLLATLACIFGINVKAQSDVSDGHIYYTELFYKYPHYLSESDFLYEYELSTWLMFNAVFSAYEESAEKTGTLVEHAVDVVTSPQKLFSFITEKFGLHSSSFDEAIDVANKMFVQDLLNKDALESIENQYGQTKSFVSRIEKMYSVFNKIAQGGIIKSAEYYIQESFDYLWDLGALTILSESQVARLWTEINDVNFKFGKYLNLASKEIEIAQAFISALIMADMEMELVDEIILSQTSDTVLKKGMERLKEQLSGGFVTYFIDNYIANELISRIYSAIISSLKENLVFKAYNIAASVLKAARVVVFDWLWDVPSYNNVIAFQVLWSYSLSMSEAIAAKTNTFIQGPFYSDKIMQYEKFYSAYLAINKSAVKLLDEIASCGNSKEYTDIYSMFDTALKNNIEKVAIKYDSEELELNSAISKDDLKLALNEVVKKGVKLIYIDNGIETKSFSVMAIMYYQTMLDAVTAESGGSIVSWYNDTYGNINVYTEYINDLKRIINNISISERFILDTSNYVYDINGYVQLKEQSEKVEPSCIYASGYVIDADIKIVDGLLLIPTDSTVILTGDLDIPYGNRELKVYGDFTVVGDLSINGNSGIYNYGNLDVKGDTLITHHTSFYGAKILNHGRFSCNNLTVAQDIETFDFSDDSYMFVRGGISFNEEYPYTIPNIVFNGNSQQTVSNLHAKNITVENPAGLKYLSDLNLYGHYALKGNALELNGYTTIANKNSSFDGSDFITVEAKDFYLDGVLNADVTVTGYMGVKKSSNSSINGMLNIPMGQKTVKVWGKLTIANDICMDGNSGLYNYGELKANDSIVITSKSSYYGAFIANEGSIYCKDITFEDEVYSIEFTDNARLYVSGNANFSPKYNYIIPYIILNGDQRQTVSNAEFKVCVIENKSSEGVIFDTRITVSTLFNHKGNVFKISSGTFVDYDGDGLNDNVDPYPVCFYHAWNEGYEKKAATYYENGLKTYTCVDCGHENNEIIERLIVSEFVKHVNLISCTSSVEQRYSTIRQAYMIYNELTNVEKQGVKSNFELLQNAVEEYNERANRANTALKIATEVSVSPLVNYLFVISACLLLLVKKFIL